MEWYYADGKERRGPASDAQMQELASTGKIQPETLVWNSTLPDWKPARETALFPTPGTDAGNQRCIITGKIYPVSLMIKTQHGWVSNEGKDRYYQSLYENVPLPVASGSTNARRDGKKFVIPVAGAQMPPCCVKTGEPVSLDGLKPKTLYWCTPWAALSILISLLIYLILYLVLRKKVVLQIPLSPAGKTIIRKRAFIATGVCLGGIALIILGGVTFDLLAWRIFTGFLGRLGGLLYPSYRERALRVTKVIGDLAWVTGAGPQFLNRLPEF